MRTSELFVLAAKLVTITGLDWKNHPDIKPHERDAIENGFRELNFFDPDFIKRYEREVGISADFVTKYEQEDKSVAAGTVRKPGRPPKGLTG